MIKNTFNPNPEAEQFENCDSVCPDCIATWFTETPEDIEYMTIYRRDVRNGFRMSIM